MQLQLLGCHKLVASELMSDFSKIPSWFML